MRLLIACALAGCYSPSVAPCQYACASGRKCPDGLTCSTTGNMCVASAGDTCMVDAAVDSSPPTPCTLFGLPRILGAPATPRTVAIADVDGDASGDVVVGSSTGNAIYLYRGPPNALTAQAAIGSGVMGLAIVPSMKEVVSSQQSSPNDIIEWLPVSATAFGAGMSTSAGSMVHPGPIAVAQLDSDGILDLAVTETNGMAIATFGGVSTGAFSLTGTIPLGANPLAIAAAHLDTDNYADLVVLLDNMTYQVVLNDGTLYAPQLPVMIHGSPAAILLADLDADARVDLVVAAGSSVSVAHGNPGGTFGDLTDVASIALPRGLAVGDFDRDGKPDIAVTSSQSSTVTVIEGNGDGTFRTPAPIDLPSGSQPWAIAAGDLDGDGFDDVAVSLSSSNQLAVLFDTCMP
jgi:hypothetical protein